MKVVDAAGGGIPNVRVYAFTGRGRYIGVGGRTGADGIVVFDLADGDYKFRADYQRRRYWSDVVTSPDTASPCAARATPYLLLQQLERPSAVQDLPPVGYPFLSLSAAVLWLHPDYNALS